MRSEDLPLERNVGKGRDGRCFGSGGSSTGDTESDGLSIDDDRLSKLLGLRETGLDVSDCRNVVSSSQGDEGERRTRDSVGSDVERSPLLGDSL